MIVKASSFAALVFCLCGCSEIQSQFADRYGPSPTPSVAYVTETTNREVAVVKALFAASSYNDRVANRDNWYSVILTGFNTVDDACTTYINDLWKLSRQKSRLKDFITASGAATAAIIGAQANPSPATLTTLAQSFGLASALTNTLAESYLFAQEPATIGKIVKRLQVAYRNDLATNLQKSEYPIASYAAVYYHMREYLSLCLPPTIQGQIDDLLAKAQATTEKSNKPDTTEKATTSPTLKTPGKTSQTDTPRQKTATATTSLELKTLN